MRRHVRDISPGTDLESTKLCVVVNFFSWRTRVILSHICVFRLVEVRFDNIIIARTVNKLESHQSLFQIQLISWLGWSHAITNH